jgi:hypothetical protein
MSRTKFYDVMPDDLRDVVDLLVREFRPEPWPVRFLTLLLMLLARVEHKPEHTRHYEINAWMALVTGVLEHLKPDVSQPECLALMSVSVSEQLQAEAAAQIAQDPTVNDHLRAAYSDWMTAENLLDEFDEWAKSQLSEGKPH